MKKTIVSWFAWALLLTTIITCVQYVLLWIDGAAGSFLYGSLIMLALLQIPSPRVPKGTPFWSWTNGACLLSMLAGLLAVHFGAPLVFDVDALFKTDRSIGVQLLGMIAGFVISVVASVAFDLLRGKHKKPGQIA